MENLNNIEKTLKYYELLMVRNLNDIKNCELPSGFKFVFWDSDDCLNDWINIHTETGEFCSLNEANEIFHQFYDGFYDQLSKRCLFVVDKNNVKVATATISPANEYGYDCVIDWFAVSPKAQGLKLSKPLLYKTLQTAKDLGYNKILLHTQTHTWLAAKIYLVCGFEPFMTTDNLGWDILKTITNHPALKNFKTLKKQDLFDALIVKIKQKLDTLHSNYTYSVWYINGRNDVFVKEGNKYFKYLFKLNNNTITLEKVE